jgi:hypothetical protein
MKSLFGVFCRRQNDSYFAFGKKRQTGSTICRSAQRQQSKQALSG